MKRVISETAFLQLLVVLLLLCLHHLLRWIPFSRSLNVEASHGLHLGFLSAPVLSP